MAGSWQVAVTLDAGSGQATFDLQVDGNTITGTYGGVLGELPLTGTIEGNVVRLAIDSPDAGNVTFTGTLQGDRLEGTCVYGGLGSGTFVGTRRAS